MGLTLVSRNNPLASSQEQLYRLALTTACAPFETTMTRAGLAPLHATGITVLQINVGKLCNQTCRHCHVDAGPERRERMTRETAELCIKALAHSDIPTVDITGGASFLCITVSKSSPRCPIFGRPRPMPREVTACLPNRCGPCSS